MTASRAGTPNPAESVVGLAFLPDWHAGDPYADPAQVASLVREALLQAGLGHRDPAAPLADLIAPGASVLLKPNWVSHHNHSGEGLDCLVTHPAFLLAALREVAAARPGRILVGDAPIQGCDFDALVSPDLRRALGDAAECPVEVIDFRRTALRGAGMEEGVLRERRPAERYVLFDLGRESLLEPISTRRPGFRVTNYDPDELAKMHRPGRHAYLLCREAFEVDVVLNLPKLKTHGKVGMTAALKNLVGINGSKDYLPHHRVGGARLGGDCYAGVAPLKRLAEALLDRANRRINTPEYERWCKRAYRVLGWHARFGDTNIEGAWFGNDTTWRMVLDLNRILVYGHADGTLSDEPARRVFSLTDALVAGEGEGPLCPTPAALGAVSFARSSAFADLAHSALIGFDWRRLPVVREAFAPFRYSLAGAGPDALRMRAGGRALGAEEVSARLGRPLRAPRGWAGHVEMGGGR